MTQDDPGDGLYLLLSGRLRVSVATGGTERVLHDLARGSVVGEIALVSNRPRSATVRAVRDSDLLLRVSSFDALVERIPALLGQMARLLVDRLLAVDRPQLPACRPPDHRDSPGREEHRSGSQGRRRADGPAGPHRIGLPAGRRRRWAASGPGGSPARTRPLRPERAHRVAACRGTRQQLRRLSDGRRGHGLEPALSEPVRRHAAHRRRWGRSPARRGRDPRPGHSLAPLRACAGPPFPAVGHVAMAGMPGSSGPPPPPP